LVGPDKQENLEMLCIEAGQCFQVDVFVVDEDEVGTQGFSPLMTMPEGRGVWVAPGTVTPRRLVEHVKQGGYNGREMYDTSIY
jgi:hypothetical protein